MIRTTLLADPLTMSKLKGLARDRGVSLATVVREALEEKAMEYLPSPTWIGIFDSGAPSDVAGTIAIERVPVEDR